MTLTIGVDVGGTKVAAGVVDEQGQVCAQTRLESTAEDPAALVAEIASAIDTCRRGFDVEAVGIAAAGFIDFRRGLVLFAPNIAWRDLPLRDEIEARCGLPTTVDNDANAAAWGEYVYGAGRAEDVGGDLVAVTVGTGIGGGIVVDGVLLRGHWGIAAEIGHIRVEPNGRLCPCGNRGCLEQYAAGPALLREAQWRAGDDPAGAAALLALGDGTPEGIEGAHVTAAAQAGDPVALAAFGSVARWLGQGLADLAAVLDPAVFVIGGGVASAGAPLLDPLRASYADLLTASGHRPIAEIRQAELGNAGLVGAADLARRAVQA
jgi:glucokinase